MTNAARSIFNPLLFVSSRRPSQLSLIPLRRRRKMLVIPTLSSDLEAATSIPSGGGVDQKNSFHVTLTAKDEAQLATPDAEFKLQTWDDLKTIIAENRIADLKRVPSDLRRYLIWSEETKKTYGTIKDFILQERLKWDDLTPKDTVPFNCEDDLKILLNDWPYGNAKGIYHLVVWTKASIETCPPLGDLTPESRRLIEEFVRSRFNSLVGDDNVLWFKNWASIQSVRAVEHVHVLVRNPTEEQLVGWVGKEEAKVAIQRFG